MGRFFAEGGVCIAGLITGTSDARTSRRTHLINTGTTRITVIGILAIRPFSALTIIATDSGTRTIRVLLASILTFPINTNAFFETVVGVRAHIGLFTETGLSITVLVARTTRSDTALTTSTLEANLAGVTIAIRLAIGDTATIDAGATGLAIEVALTHIRRRA